MKYSIYSIRDKHMGFTQPLLYMNDQLSIRGFANSVNNAPVGSDLGFAPGDFDLYKLGTFDTDSGLFDCGIPEFMISGTAVVGVGNYEKEV